MLSALIPSEHSYPAVLLAEQPVHKRFVQPGPLVLRSAPLKSPAPTADTIRTVSRMFTHHYWWHGLCLHPSSLEVRGRRVIGREFLSTLAYLRLARASPQSLRGQTLSRRLPSALPSDCSVVWSGFADISRIYCTTSL